MSEFDSRLTAYALGLLSAEEYRSLSQELEGNEELCHQLMTIEDWVYTLEDNQAALQPQPTLLSNILSSLEVSTHPEYLVKRLKKLFNLSSRVVHDLLSLAQNMPEKSTLIKSGPTKNAPNNTWVSSGIAGVYLFHLEGGAAVKNADCGLVYLEPGTNFPAHKHLGDEWALLLKGSIVEEDGSEHTMGDICFSPASSEHTFHTLDNESAMLAVVSYSGIEFIPPATHEER